MNDEKEIVVEAASLATAIDGRRSGRLGDGGADTTNSLGGADLPSEVLALERLARCYTRSPIVRAVRMEIRRRREATTGPEPQGIGRT